MNDYFVGSGALLTTRAGGSISGAAFHAQFDPLLACVARAVAVDFEGSSQPALERLLVCAAGWTASRFRSSVLAPLILLGDATLGDVLNVLASSTHSDTVHLFARWLPSATLCRELAEAGVTLVALPLDAIRRGALISGQRRQGFTAGLRAA